MEYLFTYRAAFTHGGDDCEGNSRNGVEMSDCAKRFEAQSNEEAVQTVIGVMQNESRTYFGKNYPVEAIALHQVVDISFLHRGNAA